MWIIFGDGLNTIRKMNNFNMKLLINFSFIEIQNIKTIGSQKESDLNFQQSTNKLSTILLSVVQLKAFTFKCRCKSIYLDFEERNRPLKLRSFN
jgi:hypothetical protein